MKPFEVEFKGDDDGVFRGKAGVGCVVLSVVWALAALGFVVLGLIKVMR